MRERLDIGKVIILLYESYKDALKNPMVSKPVSYALYEVWQYADSIEKPKCGQPIIWQKKEEE